MLNGLSIREHDAPAPYFWLIKRHSPVTDIHECKFFFFLRPCTYYWELGVASECIIIISLIILLYILCYSGILLNKPRANLMSLNYSMRCCWWFSLSLSRLRPLHYKAAARDWWWRPHSCCSDYIACLAQAWPGPGWLVVWCAHAMMDGTHNHLWACGATTRN